MDKLPARPDRDRLASTEPELVAFAPHSTLWRIHNAAGEWVRPWNELRRFGPVRDCRFDPHEPPPRVQSEGVAYFALDVATAVAERFQHARNVDRRFHRPHLVGFRPSRTLRLLDLTGTWPLRAGASHVINTGRHDICRAWARAIRATWPDVDGLWHTSSLTALPCATLWNPAADAFPAAPAIDTPLTHAGLVDVLERICTRIGYTLV